MSCSKIKTTLFLLLIMTAHSVYANMPQSPISYTLSFPEAQAHYVNVTMQIENVAGEELLVKMPVWAPGSYLIREFSRHVEAFEAKVGNAILQVEKTSKNAWKIKSKPNSIITITYKVYAYELTVRTSFVDASHAYLNGSSIFMYVDGAQELPSTITIEPYTGWQQISTALERSTTNKLMFSAPNYDVLADSPFEIGNHAVVDFVAADIPHSIAMYGQATYDKERLIKDFTKIIEEETAMFGENPCKNYTFIVHNVANGGGGLEHLNSTTLQTSRFTYQDETAYAGFLSLVAHEYFHLWNVKRLRPIELGPFNYDEENYTSLLWIAEGFTAYYDELFVRRTNFNTVEKYLNTVAGNIGTVENSPGNKVQPLSEASLDAWIKYYRRNENSRNATISYYDKGSIIATLIDLRIMDATKAKKSLDDVMKLMYDRHYKNTTKGYTEADFIKALEEVSGVKWDAFFASYIHGTQAIDYATYFAYAGLKLVNKDADSKEPYLGAQTTVTNGKTLVTAVVRGSAAWNDGLNVNDEIIAVDNFRVDDLSKLINMKKSGDVIKLLISRDGVIQTLSVTLGTISNARYKLEKVENATAQQNAVYKKWLKAE